jgi:hypothetical protein
MDQSGLYAHTPDLGFGQARGKEPAMTKPADADHVTSYGGDAFGNGSNNLWRCQRCNGLFYTGAAHDEPIRMGLILIEDRGMFSRQRREKAAELYRRQPHCQCEDREEIQNPGRLDWSFRRGQPPFDWPEMLREAQESLDKKDEES